MTRWSVRNLRRHFLLLFATRSGGGAGRGTVTSPSGFYLLAGQSADYYLRAGSATDRYKRAGT